jgi:hypothetical protein
VFGNGAHAAVEAYNPATNTWRSLQPMPTARHGIQAAVLRGDIYIAAGGKSEGGGNTTDVLERLTVGPQPACPAPPATGSGGSGSGTTGGGGATTTPSTGSVPACCGAPAPPPGPPAPVPPAGTTPVPPIVGPVDRIAPRLRDVKLSRSRFHSVSSGTRYGTTLRLTISEPARIRLTVRRRSGRKLVAVKGSVSRQARSGRNTVRFTGRIAGKRLAAGRYVLAVVAVDTAGNRSAVVRRSFSILTRPRART